LDLGSAAASLIAVATDPHQPKPARSSGNPTISTTDTTRKTGNQAFGLMKIADIAIATERKPANGLPLVC
jgi:hypothetical protein